MASTVVVALRRAIRDGLDALTGAGGSLAGVSVTYGWNPKMTDRYQIFTMRPRGEHSPASLKAGRNFRDETATFQLVVHVEEVGGDAEDGDLKALSYGLVVEEYLADNKQGLGVAGVNSLYVEGWELTGGPADRGYIAQLIYTIRYNARLT